MADTLHLSALRTQSLPFRIQEFINASVVDIANKTLVQAIRNEASLRNMPQRYIDGIHAEFVSGELWIWVDFKGKKGEPLDLFFEEGTPDHPILPKNKKVLSWISGGIRYFSKGHWITGVEARHIFRNGTIKGYPKFKALLKTETEAYIEETKLFGR